MITTAYATFGKRPKALDGVSVCIAIHILTARMVDLFMLIAKSINGIINGVFVRVDDGFLGNILGNQGHYGRTLGISDNLANNLAVPLSNPDNGGLAFGPTPPGTRSLSANVSFINLNLVGEYAIAFVKKCSNLFEHTPSCFVGHAMFALKCHSGEASSCRRYFMDSIKPYSKGCRSLMEYSLSQWANLMPTATTFINWTFGYLMMLRNLLAYKTIDTVRVTKILDPFEASIITGKIPFKVFGGKLLLSSFLFHRNHPLFSYSIAQEAHVVKG